MSDAPSSLARLAIAKGVVIAGRYRVERQIAVTDLGALFEARHVQLDDLVLLKVFTDDVRDPRLTAKFLREARNAARVRSEHVARFHDSGTLDDGRPFLVMEHVVGRDLQQILKSREPIATTDAVDWIVDACRALVVAHAAGILHRDLRPSSFYVVENGNRRIVKLMNFGASRVASSTGQEEDQGLTVAGLGTSLPDYTAPEVILNGSGDARADVWSLGAVLFELFVGQAPFAGEPYGTVQRILTASPPPPRMFRSDLPPELDAIVMQCLRKQPAERFPDVASLAAALAPFGGRGSWRLPAISLFETPDEALVHFRRPDGSLTRAETTDLARAPPPPPVSGARSWLRGLQIVSFVSFAGIVAWLVFAQKTVTLQIGPPPPPATVVITATASPDSPPEPPASAYHAEDMPPPPAAPQVTKPSQLAPRPRRAPVHAGAADAGAAPAPARPGDPWGWRR